jgi:hypothetical protein
MLVVLFHHILLFGLLLHKYFSPGQRGVHEAADQQGGRRQHLVRPGILSSLLGMPFTVHYTVKKPLPIFQCSTGMSLTKLSLGGNNLIIPG